MVSAPGGASIALTEIDYYVALMNGATRAALGGGGSSQVGDVDATAPAPRLREVAQGLLDVVDPPDGVFCLYERLAVELLAAHRERRIGVPTRLTVRGSTVAPPVRGRSASR